MQFTRREREYNRISRIFLPEHNTKFYIYETTYILLLLLFSWKFSRTRGRREHVFRTAKWIKWGVTGNRTATRWKNHQRKLHKLCSIIPIRPKEMRRIHYYENKEKLSNWSSLNVLRLNANYRFFFQFYDTSVLFY